MSDRYPNANFDSQADGESEEEGFDLDALKEKVGFVLRAPRRRPKLAIIVFLLIAVLGVTISITMPRTYNAQVKLLAQSGSNVMTPILDPGHAGGDESPTKNVAEVILRRDNLIALVKQANLLDRFYASRSPALKLKDYLMSLVSEPMTEEDKLRGLVATLEKKLTVVTDSSSITISVDWADAEMAYELVAIVQNNFLDAKYDSTVSMITDAIAILTDHSKTEAAQVDQALDEVARVQAAKNQAAIEAGQRAAVPPPAVPGVRRSYAPATPRAPAAPPPDADLMKQLEDTRHQIKSIEDERTRQLDTLRQQLAQAQLAFTPLHPTVQALQQKVDALKESPPELVQLHAQERALMAKIAPTATPQTTPAPATAQQTGQPQAAPVAPAAPEPVRPIILPSSNEEDGPSRLARSKLESAIYNYQEVMSRIDAAKLRLDINRAQFKYRYSVITPPEVPKKPKKPITTMIGIGSVIGAVLLAFLVAGIADMAAGRVIEPWQVKRQLKIEVLGEFEAPK